eukprot:2140015-Rhodomonas_salina.1
MTSILVVCTARVCFSRTYRAEPQPDFQPGARSCRSLRLCGSLASDLGSMLLPGLLALRADVVQVPTTCKVFDFGVVAAPDALDPLCPVLTSGAPLPDWTSVRTDTTQTPAGSGPRCHSLQCDSSCHFLASDIGHASTRYNRLVFSSTIPPRSGQDSTPDSKSMSRLKEMAMDRREGAEGSRVAVLKSLLPPHSSTMLSVGSE